MENTNLFKSSPENMIKHEKFESKLSDSFYYDLLEGSVKEINSPFISNNNQFIPNYLNIHFDLMSQIINFIGVNSFNLSIMFSHFIYFVYYGVQVNIMSTIILPYKQYNNFSDAEIILITTSLVVGMFFGGFLDNLQSKIIGKRSTILKVNFFLSVFFNFIFSTVSIFGLCLAMRFFTGFFMSYNNPFYNKSLIQVVPFKIKNFILINLITGAILGQMLILLVEKLVMPYAQLYGINEFMIIMSGMNFSLFILFCIFYSDSPKVIISEENNSKEGFQVFYNEILNRKFHLNENLKRLILYEIKYPYEVYYRKSIIQESIVKKKYSFKTFDNFIYEIYGDIYSIEFEEKLKTSELFNEEKLDKYNDDPNTNITGKYLPQTIFNSIMLSLIWYTYFGITATPTMFVVSADSKFTVNSQIIINCPNLGSLIVLSFIVLIPKIKLKWILFTLQLCLVVFAILIYVLQNNTKLLLAFVTCFNVFSSMAASIIYRLVTLSYDFRTREKGIGVSFLFAKIFFVLTICITLSFSYNNSINYIIFIVVTIINMIVTGFYPESLLKKNDFHN